ncbi:hypothetical protein AB0I55_13510 [Actinocatenispora sera]|uniref:COG4315 family predicted lipoprotein n=1 Tax=Actinocatenispora sera TaxID=390989 RepID=UPI00068D963F|nr:hypothetical protein [Actinocatenispora sera]
MSQRRSRRLWWLAPAAAAPLIAAGCSAGSSSSTGSSGGSTNHSAGSSAPVSARSTGQGKVLVDSAGHALYSPAGETTTHLMCDSAACTAIWPVATASGTVPSTVPGASGTLGTLHRSDGKTQLTYNGHPLYRFSADQGAGSVTGDGTKDSFGGTKLTWHVIRLSGKPASSPSSQNGGGYNY